MAAERPRVLDRRTLNRTLLRRQFLLDRQKMRPARAIRHVVALQAQEPLDPYVGLWTRVDGFDPLALSTSLERRRTVRMTLLRGTLHLVTADDAVALRPVLQPAIQATFSGSGPLRSASDAVPRDVLLAFIRSCLDERARSRADLARAIAERWPDHDADALAYAMYLLPTVQVTPRGLWGQTGRAAFTTMEAWLGAGPSDDDDPADLLRRYLRAFGPATVADAQTWSRLSGLRDVVERLRPTLRVFRDEQGRELFDVPRAPIVDPDTPAPVRFLPQYDNVLLAHKDRSRVVADGTDVWTEVGWGTVLVDGFTAARWRLGRGTARLDVEPFRLLARSERAEIADEGRRLLDLLAPDLSPREVRIAREVRGG